LARRGASSAEWVFVLTAQYLWTVAPFAHVSLRCGMACRLPLAIVSTQGILESDILVVGAGPAGLAAAAEAARGGGRVVIIDENPSPGGQIFRPRVVPASGVGGPVERIDRIKRRLFAELESFHVPIVLSTTVWGVLGNRLLCEQQGRGLVVPWRRLVIATGASERIVPCPGWTLPGVVSAGGAQILAKSGAKLGRRALVAGSGPFLVSAALELAAAGVDVVAVIEAHSLSWLASRLWRLSRHTTGFRDAVGYLRGLWLHGIRYRFGQAVVRILGEERVTGAVIVEVDRQWRALSGTETPVEVDTVCLGYGFIPGTDLTGLLGCEHRYDRIRGGWVVVHDAQMETTQRGIYVAGEVTGIGGAEVAIAEGRLAGAAAARSPNGNVQKGVDLRISATRRQLVRPRAFADLLLESFPFRPGIYGIVTPSTVVCRCEEVTAGELEPFLTDSQGDFRFVRTMARPGMGLCQARICGPIVRDLLAQHFPQPLLDGSEPTPRTPIKPVPWPVLSEVLAPLSTPDLEEGLERGNQQEAHPPTSSAADRTVDVAIVGGGVIGASIAYFLSRAGLRPLLLERGPLCSGASGANAGFVGVLGGTPDATLPLRQAGMQWLARLSLELDHPFEFVQEGRLILATSDEDLLELQILADRWLKIGQSVRMLTASEVADLEPALNKAAITGGMYGPTDGHLNPFLLTHAFAGTAQRLGAVIQTHTSVVDLIVDNGRVAGVRTSVGAVLAQHVVLANGAWVGDLTGRIGVHLMVRPGRGQMLISEPLRPITPRVIQGVGLGVRQTTSGNLMLGSSVEYVGFDKRVTPLVGTFATKWLDLMPSLQHVRVIRTWAGLRPMTPDGNPLLGALPQVPGLWVATGHGRYGMTWSGITGHIIADLILGRTLQMDLTAVSPIREASFGASPTYQGEG